MRIILLFLIFAAVCSTTLARRCCRPRPRKYQPTMKPEDIDSTTASPTSTTINYNSPENRARFLAYYKKYIDPAGFRR